MSEPGVEVPDDAPEADVLEQAQPSSGLQEEELPTGEAPVEANPADFDEQRRSIGGEDEEDYR